MNGFLGWADIQRHTTAENTWKAQAIKHFANEGITEAKEILWDVAAKIILRKIIKRASKSTSEIEDISKALTKFAEKKVFPIFIGTSQMVMQTSSFNNNCENVTSEAIFNRIKSLEDSMHACVERHNEQSEISSSGNTENKKFEEVFTRQRINEKYNKGESGELVRDAAGKDPMLSTLSPSYAAVISIDALNNTQIKDKSI